MATAPGGAGAGGSEKKLQPIIIKRVKKAAHGAHGGAWKIAYADFMTAMMAFFLLMWLLGSTSKGDLQGIAAYFNSPLKVAMQGGDGAGSSSSIIPGGGTDLARIHGQVKRSDSDEDANRRRDIDAKARRAQQDAQRIKALQAKIDAMISSNATLNEYRSQIRMDLTPDGLQIQIVDEQNRPMFDIGSADRGYGNWELSVDRANASRRELVTAGMPDDKLARVVGLSSTDLLLPDEPRAPQNRRITITVRTHEAQERLLGKSRTPVEKTVSPAALAGQNQDNPPSSAPEALAPEIPD